MAVVSVSAPVAVPADCELLAQASGGDRAALDELFRRYRTVAFRVAYRLLGREVDALDAVQEAFIKAFTHLDRFRGQSSFKTWLLRIVSNAALDMGRSRRRSGWNELPAKPLAGQEFDDGPTPESGIHRADLRKAIDGALERLPATQRQTFVLHVDGELTYREVADVLGISIGTVMSRLFYARQKLKTLLADQIEP